MNCVICGEPVIEKRSDAKYCSDKCRTRSETISTRNRIRSERVVITSTCEYCLCEFIPKPQTPYQKYCSVIPCQRKAALKRKRDSGVNRNSSYFREYKKKNADFIREINDTYHNKVRFGGNKYVVLERDEYKCTKCGRTKNIIIHHLDESGNTDNPNNDPNNLITLCRSCHMKHHASGDRNYLYKHITTEMFNEAKVGCTSFEAIAKKLNISKEVLRRKVRVLGLPTDIRKELKLNN